MSPTKIYMISPTLHEHFNIFNKSHQANLHVFIESLHANLYVFMDITKSPVKKSIHVSMKKILQASMTIKIYVQCLFTQMPPQSCALKMFLSA